MNDTSPEVEAILDALASLCTRSLEGESELAERQDGLLKSLLMNGYARKSHRTLMDDVEQRLKLQSTGTMTHRDRALSSLTAELSVRFQKLAQWESKAPSEEAPPKAVKS